MAAKRASPAGRSAWGPASESSEPLVALRPGDTITSALSDSASHACQVHPYDEWQPEDRQPASHAERAERHPHWRRWLAPLGVLVALRLALPIVVGPLAETK